MFRVQSRPISSSTALGKSLRDEKMIFFFEDHSKTDLFNSNYHLEDASSYSLGHVLFRICGQKQVDKQLWCCVSAARNTCGSETFYLETQNRLYCLFRVTPVHLIQIVYKLYTSHTASMHCGFVDLFVYRTHIGTILTPIY